MNAVSDKLFILCIPVDDAPSGYPENVTYSTYEKVLCERGCNRFVWLGQRSKKVHDELGVPIYCMWCAARDFGMENIEQHMKKLTDFDK